MQRHLEPELLDSLPPGHPDALHNRRDLRLTNTLLGTHRWLIRTLAQLYRPGEAILELGAGTGELGRQLHAVGMPADGLDLWPRPPDWPSARRWHQADLRSFPDYGQYGIVFGNLIFHQFSAGELAALGRALASGPRAIVACEPARRRRSQLLYALGARLLGANHVSRHDAHVSIAAGFQNHELSAALGLEPSHWSVRCESTWIGLYRLVAIRRS